MNFCIVTNQGGTTFIYVLELRLKDFFILIIKFCLYIGGFYANL